MESQFTENQLASEDAAAVQIFAGLDRAAMLQVFEDVLKTKPINELRPIADQLKIAFYKRLKQDTDALLAALAQQENQDTAAVIEDGLEQKLKDVLLQYRTMRNEYTQKIIEEQEQNLQKKQALIEQLKTLIEQDGEFNIIFNEFKNLQLQWREIGVVPPKFQNDLWRTYNHNVEKFYDKVKINNEMRDLDFKKNLELKQLLCEKAEELLLHDNIVNTFKTLQKLHEQWREVGPVANEYRESIWERFKEASAQINKKYSDYFEKKKQEQENNLAIKQSLCEQAESLIETLPITAKAWTAAMEQMLEMQKIWKTIGLAPQKHNETIYQRFRTACNTFFEARNHFFNDIKEEYTANVQKKTALCEQAESLSQSEDWNKATQELIGLQKQWKTIGAVPRKQSDELWNRFRNACNIFFERKKGHFETQETTYEENLKAKEAVIAEMRDYKESSDPQQNLNAIKQWQQRWVEIGFVPVKDKERLQNAYKEVLSSIYDMLKISDTERELIQFKQKIEDNQQNLSYEKERITQQMKRLVDEKKLWENNITFFAKSKNSEKIIAEVQHNIDGHTKQIEVLKEKLKLLVASASITNDAPKKK
ncbi:hypothetical protein AGMMS4956_01450 [Bacteroidia bacterium]|nr:hypothetical protein AGMMS4956_01450 [Bacteroidia bacterium]